MELSLSKVSDQDLHKEYVTRFTLPAGEIVSTSSRMVLHLRSYFAKEPDREKLVIVYLSNRNGILGTEVLFTGTISTSEVYTRELIKKVLRYSATAIILAHNHPSGNSYPSQNDRSITEKIKHACMLIDVKLHDHFILCRDGYTSFKDQGYL